jgi:murein DD-endopeptidase MepM/ murein hydrolase activator NlpD
MLTAGTLPLLPAPGPAQPAIQTIPDRVIWGADPRCREAVDSCFFSLILAGRAIRITRAVVQLFAGSSLTKTTILNESALAAIRRDAGGTADTQRFAFWFREARALALDRCAIALEGGRSSFTLDRRLERYETRTSLIVPFRGPGSVDQGWMSDNGHSNPTEQFAVDLLALSDRFARSALQPRVNADYDGWGRDIIAPAAGVVAIVQDGIPAQPRVDEIDEKSFTLADGRTVGYGNHVVIDHGNGEFSALVHLQAGSIPVRAGDRVAQGDRVGKLGSSGMSTEPHLHFQLQDRAGPPAHSLPFRFANLTRPLRRGLFFVCR